MFHFDLSIGDGPEKIAEITSGAVIQRVKDTEPSGEPGGAGQREPRPFFSGMLRWTFTSPPRTAETPKINKKTQKDTKGRGRASFQPAVYEVFANTWGPILGSCELPQLHENLRSYDIPYQLNITLLANISQVLRSIEG